MKFDPDGLELTGDPAIHLNTYYRDPKQTATFLYAVKKNGLTWADDAEMDATVETELDYYDTLEKARAKGVVVGILAEARNDDPKVDLTHIFFSVPVKVREDAETSKVYQIVTRSKVWKKAQYDEAGGLIPRRYDDGEDVSYPLIPVYYDLKGNPHTLDNWSPGPYVKAVYTDGVYKEGHRGSCNIGDSVYVTPYIVAIKKAVAQTAGGDEKKNFDLDTNQRTVDFKLSSSIKTLVSSSSNLYTDVEIVDVLPKGLRYIDNSAYFGGSYTQNPTPGRQGTVTGGTPADPIAVLNPSTGETTLTWKLDNFRVNDPIPNIIFSAAIGTVGSPDDVINNQQLLNRTWIRATHDNRAKIKSNGNYDEVGIRVSKLLATSLAKLAESKYVETSDDICWKAYVSNNGVNPYTNTVILDVLPYVGDSGGTKLANPAVKLDLIDWSVNKGETTLDNLDTWLAFYTTDETVRGTRSDDYVYDDILNLKSTLDNGDIVIWKPATFDPVSGKVSGVTGNVTALAFLGTLKGGQTLVQNIKLDPYYDQPPYDLKAGDILSNNLSRGKDVTDSPVYVLQRTLEGLLWHDDNADGTRQSGEVLFAEGTVSLLMEFPDGTYNVTMDSYENPAVIPLGKQLDLATGTISDYEPGKYKFVGLPAGNFGVRFTTDNIDVFTASPQNVGNDYTDSDAAPEFSAGGKLESTIITGIKMPPKDEMASSLYASVCNDSGLYARIKIYGTKTWDDAGNQDGKRPGTLVVQVKKGDSVVKSVTLDGVPDAGAGATGEIADWMYQFMDLPKFLKGELVQYEIAETGYEPYTPTAITQPVMEASKNAYTVNLKNSYTPEVITISGQKSWDDDDNRDRRRPLTLVVQVKNGDIVVKSVTLDGTADAAANETGEIAAWTYQFTGLPKYADGKLISYTIAETGYDPYTPTITQPVMEAGKNEYTVNLKNSYTPDTIKISGKKTWDDAGNQDGKRPATLVVNVKNGETVVKSVTLDGVADAAADATGEIAAWTYQFTGLPKYAAGVLISYTIEETGYAPYTPTTIAQPVMEASKDEYTVNLKNSYTPEVITISGAKSWDDAGNRDRKRPLTLVVQVKNGDIVVKEVTLDGTADAAANATGEVAPWKYQFTGLPKYAAGKLISYTIAETGYDPYTPTITQPVMEAGKNEYTVDLMNKYTPEVIRISGTKTWNDAEDQDGKRPAQLVVNVKNGETVVKSVTLDGVADSTGETAAWTYQFTGLPKYAAGVLISYTIEETGYAPYTPTTITQPVMEASKDEYTVDLKNSYTPEVIKISGKKTWDDAEDQDRRRPATLVVQVKNGDIVVKSVTLDGTADAAADKTGEIAAWTYQFTDLPKYAAGKLISYTIAETGYDPYTPTITQPVMEASKNEYTVNLKNSYTPDVIKISGTKTWNDAEDQDGKRPATLVVNVKNGETVVKTVTLDGTADAAANATGEIAAWTYQFTDLPKYAAGELIKYTIEETGYDPYTPTAITQPVMEASKNAYTVDLKNSYTPEVIRISGKKTWDDSENQDGKRPATLVVNVKNGATVVKSVTLDGTADAAAGETGEIAAWTYQFTDLPKYAAGDLIGYTIEETGYDPYTPATITQPVMDAAKNEYTVDLKNSYTPEVIKISGKKTWADAENRDGKRPATLVIHVKNGATVVKSVTLDGVADATGEIAAWTYQFTDLPKYAAGELIVYTIEETGYEPYTPMAITQPVMEASKNEYTVDLTNNYAPGMTIKKTAKTDTFTAAGDEIEYEVVVTNTGNVTLKGVEVTDSLVPDLKTKATLEESINADGELEVGETWTYTYTYEVTQADMDAGFVKNAVKAWNPDIPVENPNNPPPEDEVEVPGEQNPGMTIKKTAKTDTFTAAGDEIEYEIVVTNTGNVTLKKLVVTDSLDVDLETEAELVESMNPDGDLEVGETWTYTYTYEVTQADMDAGFVRNAVKATSPNFPDDDPNNPPPEDEVDVPGEQNPGMTVKKTVAPETKFTAAGDKIEYTIVVTNTGNVTLKDVKVTDSLDVDLETEAELVESINADGYLEVGETWTYTYTYEVTQEDMDAGFVKNAVKVTNPDIPDGDPENPPPEDEVDVPGEQNPGMSIKKTAKTEKYTVVGDEIEYEIVVTNTGNVTLKDVEVEDSLVPELTKKVTPEESMNADGDLEVGETWTYKYTYAVTQEDVDAGFVKNAVKAWNPDIPDEDPENPPPEDEVVVVKPRYLVEKTATEDRYFNAGDTIHYTVTVTNLEDVTVEGLTVKDSLVDFADMELTESVNTNGDLDVGEVWTLTYSYEVTEEDVTRGSVLNRVTVTNPADPDKPVEDEEEVFKPSYTVTKEADEACFCRAGDTIHYTVTVSNTGELDIHDLEIEDSLADFEEMELVEDGLENGILDVDETWTLTYSYTMTEADAAAGHVLNKVTVTDPADPENPEEDEETVPKSSYTVVKEVIETEFYKAGDILHYTITVTNTGEVAIGDLVVEDSLVALDNMKLVESVAANGILDVGETWVLTYTYTVTEADAVAGSVLNKVIVTELIEGEEPPENPPTDEVITPRVPDPNEPTPVPRTGRDDSPWSLWLGLILLSAGAVLVLLRKKGFLDANDER
ncbi:MAG: Cna B-type domain-containing protein [Bacillota bacterium]|nr:Cna B-type domain-containing protein [Bacillota bacterium]